MSISSKQTNNNYHGILKLEMFNKMDFFIIRKVITTILIRSGGNMVGIYIANNQ